LIIRLRDELGKWKRVDGEYWVNPTPASNHAENSRVPVCSGVCLVVKVDSSGHTLEIYVLDDVDELVDTSLTIVKKVYKLNI
jgi:hypothetical protein